MNYYKLLLYVVLYLVLSIREIILISLTHVTIYFLFPREHLILQCKALTTMHLKFLINYLIKVDNFEIVLILAETWVGRERRADLVHTRSLGSFPLVEGSLFFNVRGLNFSAFSSLTMLMLIDRKESSTS